MKVYLRGFFCVNLGDDLFIHILAQRYPQVEFYLIANSEYSEAYSSEKNIEVIKVGKLERAIRKLFNKFFDTRNIYEEAEKRSDVSIVIGGSMFQEFQDDKNALEKLKSFPGQYSATYILGINFGPFHTQNYLKHVSEYLKQARDVCFRDTYSYTFFQELNNVRWARDIVFNIEQIIPKTKKRVEKKICAISVMNFNNKYNLKKYSEAYVEFLIRAIKNYCSEAYEIHLISFCKMEGDESAIEEIMEKCDDNLKKHIKKVKYNGKNWKQVVRDISEAKCIIATRFHSMILGLAYQVPTLPIIYSKKMAYVLEDLGYYNVGLNLEDLYDSEINSLKFVQLENSEEIKQEAEKQFEALDKLFGRI